MKYVMNRDDLNGFIDFIGAETKVKGKEVVFRYCPRCAGSAPKDDEWKFAVNWQTGAFGCLRGSCGYHGHFVELCRDFGYKLGMDAEREYRLFPQPPRRIEPRESALAYLAGRGISKETAERYEVTAYEKRPNVLFFPFFNEFGKLVFIKYRNMAFKKNSKGSKEWCESGGQPILFGMKQATGTGTLVITEGQLDSLSVAEAFKDVSGTAKPDAFCSVPIGMNGFTWLPNCFDWIKRFDRVIVFGDLEHGHMSLLDTLKQRLPNMVLAVRQEDYLGEKDANDILRSFGPEAVRKAVENAQEPNIGYVKELADVEDVDLNKLPKVRTGFYEIDSALGGGICFGQVCLLTGKRGNGKSTFMSNIVANAIDQGCGTFCYSGELAGYHFKRWLNCQLAGNDHMVEEKNEYGDTIYTIDPAVSRQISEWYRGKAFIYDNEFVEDGKEETTALTEIIREVASRRNVKLICIDNLMTAMEAVREQSNLYLAQSNFVGELKKIAVRYDVAIILVAHPRKQGKNEDPAFDNDDVSGSGDITNKVDIVMSYGRAKEGAGYDSELVISKNRLAGTLKMGSDKIQLNYSAKTKRVFGVRSLNKRYGWEQKGTDVTAEIDVPF